MRIVLLLLAISLPRLGPLPLQADASADAAPVRSHVVLFDGTTLDRFQPFLRDTRHADPRHVFSITNRSLRISGDGLGYLATRAAYSQYRLTFEFRWGQTNTAWAHRQGKASDSGVFLHASGPHGNSHDGDGAFMAAIECNLFQGATGDLLLIRGNAADGTLIAPRLSAETANALDAEGWPTWSKGGTRRTLERWGRLNWFGKDPAWRDVFDFRGARDHERPRGEWNRIECVCEPHSISVYLNNQLVNQATDVHPTSGRILFQCEGSEIFFRNIELQPLARSAPPDMEGGLRVKAGDALLFVPTNHAPSAVQATDLLIHLHGAPRIVERAFLTSQPAHLLLTLTLPGLSDTYRQRLEPPGSLDQLLETAATTLRAIGRPTPTWRRVSVSSFSAGFGGVRALLADPLAFNRLDAILLADSLYCGYAEGGPGAGPEPRLMEGFLRFAQEAAAGRKRFVLSHSAQVPEGYASTTETSAYLLRALGLERAPIKTAASQDWLPATQALRGEFLVLGYPGNQPEDHMAHLRHIDHLFAKLLPPSPPDP